MILIDAHLHPSERTDAGGHPLSLKTDEFYRGIARRLSPDGEEVRAVLFESGRAVGVAAWA